MKINLDKLGDGSTWNKIEGEKKLKIILDGVAHRRIYSRHA
jgi:hypothetical protein